MSNEGLVLYQRGENEDEDAWDDSALIKAYDSAVSAMKAKIAEKYPEIGEPGEEEMTKKKKKKKTKPKQARKARAHVSSSSEWSVGDVCLAVFTEDGEIYKGRILSIDVDSNTCTVRYLGYGNEEEQSLADLMPLDSMAASAQVDVPDPASEEQSGTDNGSDRESTGQREEHGKKAKQPKITKSKKSSFCVPPPRWPWSMPPPPPEAQMPAGPAFASFAMPQHQSFPPIPPPPPQLMSQGADGENEALYSMLIAWYMSGYHTGYYQALPQTLPKRLTDSMLQAPELEVADDFERHD